MSTSPAAVEVTGQMMTLTSNAQRARYGVSYLRNICAQAGVGLNETSPDEDALATDCDIAFPEGNVRVQVKCSSQFTLGGRTKSWKLDPEWIRKWGQSLVPVYFVLVVVPRSENLWLDHSLEGTMHRTAAFWQRINAVELGNSITIPKIQRLTASTLSRWHTDLVAAFDPAGIQ